MGQGERAICDSDYSQLLRREKCQPLLDDPLTASHVAAGENGSYSKIPGFVMRAGATVMEQSSYLKCENKCSAEENCRSFSFREADKTCVWSISSLTFDPDFFFATKSANPNARNKYRVFAGMSYRTQGWTIVGGVAPSKCEAMCTASEMCKAYSSRAKDKLCLLGPKGVTYSPDFSYYEKKGIPYVPFPLLAPGAVFSCTGAMCPKKPDAVDDPTKDPMLGAMESAAKSKNKVADKEVAKELAKKSEAAATIQQEKQKGTEKIEKVKSADREKLVKMETKARLGDISALNAEEQKLMRDAAAAQAMSMQENAGKKTEAAEEKAAKAQRIEEKRAAELAQKGLADGNRAQDEIMGKMAEKDKDFKVVHEELKASHAGEQAKLDKKKAAAEEEMMSEKEKKENVKAKEELKTKEVKAKAFKEVVQKLANRKIPNVQKKAQESSDKRISELKQKGAITVQEISFKEANERCAKEKEGKKRAKDAEARMKVVEKASKVTDKKVSEKDKKILEQVELKKKREDEAETELRAKADEAKMKANNKRIAAEGITESLTKKNEQALLEVKEQGDKNEAKNKAMTERVAQGYQSKVQKKVDTENEKAHKHIEVDLKEYKVKQAPLIAKKKELAEKVSTRAAENAAYYKSESTGQKVVSEKEHKKVTEAGAKAKVKADDAAAKAKAEAAVGVKSSAAAAVKKGTEIVAELKVKAMEKLGVYEADIVAGVGAFVDSGDGMIGIDVDALKNQEAATKQINEDAEKDLKSKAKSLQTAAAHKKVVDARTLHSTSAPPKAPTKAPTEASTKAPTKAPTTLAPTAAPTYSSAFSSDSATSVSSSLATSEPASAAYSSTGAAPAPPAAAGGQRRLLQAAATQAAYSSAGGLSSAAAATDKAQAAQTSAAQNQQQSNQASDSQASSNTTARNSAAAGKANAALETKASTDKAGEQAKAQAKTQAKVQQAVRDLASAKRKAKKAFRTARDAMKKAATAAEQTKTKHNEAKSDLEKAKSAPANTAYGTLNPAELRVLGADKWKMNSYLKFDMNSVKEADTLVSGTLKLFKVAGGSGDIKVFATSCAWNPKSITYTSAEVSPGGLVLNQVSTNSKDDKIPEEEGVFMTIKLHGSVLQSARLHGDSVCVRVSGGPSENKVIFASPGSATDSQKPVLKLMVKKNQPVKVENAPDVGPTNDGAEQRKIAARNVYKVAEQGKLQTQEEEKEKDKLVKEKTGPGGEVAGLKKKRAIYKKDANNEAIFDPFAGMDKKVTEEARDDNIAKALLKAVAAKKEELKSADENAIAGEMEKSPYAIGTDDYTKEKDALEEQKKKARAVLVAAFSKTEGEKLKTVEQKKMEDTIKAKVDEKAAAIDTQLKQVKCKTIKDCTLSIELQSVVEGRVATNLEKVMQQYDLEHGTKKLNSKEVAAIQAKTEQKVAEIVKKEKTAALVASEAKPATLQKPGASTPQDSANAKAAQESKDTKTVAKNTAAANKNTTDAGTNAEQKAGDVLAKSTAAEENKEAKASAKGGSPTGGGGGSGAAGASGTAGATNATGAAPAPPAEAATQAAAAPAPQAANATAGADPSGAAAGGKSVELGQDWWGHGSDSVSLGAQHSLRHTDRHAETDIVELDDALDWV